MQMTDDKLVTYLKQYVQEARDFKDTKLQSNWTLAQKYYFGEVTSPVKKGRSSVVSRDVSDAIDWMLPSLMDIFASGKNAVLFDPQTAEDVELAEQQTQYANYVFYRKNDGFSILYNWFKDALLFKRGIIKHYWDVSYTVTTERYGNLDPGQYEALLAQDNIEPLEIVMHDDGFYDLVVNKVATHKKIKIKNVPPEEFLIDNNATCEKTATFVGQQYKVTRSALREMGYSEELIEALPWGREEEYDSTLKSIREDFNGSGGMDRWDSDKDEANQKVPLIEAYVRIDYDGDGIAELRRIVYSSNVVLSNEDWDIVPYSTLCPNPIPHEFYGQSVFDVLQDVQDIKTALVRNQLDNMYLTNNGRYVAVEGQVNLADLQNNTPGGVVREKMQGALRPLIQPPLPQGAYDMIGYMDELKTNRTGVSARTQGLDDKILNSHTGQGQVNRVMSVAEQRLKLVARIFAETGVRSLFVAIAALAKKYQDEAEVFKLNGKFVEVDPATWNDRSDMEVIVGIGAQDKDQQLMHLMRLFELTQAVVGNGGMGILTNERKVYSLLKEITENAGYKDPEKFWLDPTSEESLKAKEAQIKAAMKPKPEDIKAQADMLKQQSDAQIDQLGVKLAQDKQGMEMQVKMKELALAEREMALKEREQALEEDKQDMERERFEWEKQVNISEVILEREAKKSVAIGDGKM